MERRPKRAAEGHPFRPGQEVFRVSFRSRLAEREPVIDAVLESLRDHGLHPDPFLDRLLLDEVISNAIVHGNKEDARKSVTVRAFCQRERWGFEVADQGGGFDWRALEERLQKPLDQTSPSGRGLALVHAAGASVHYLDEGRCVVVVRRRETGPDAGAQGADPG